MTIYSLYKFTNLVNHKVYIGITNNPDRRQKVHRSMAANDSQYLIHKALRKYGDDRIVFEVIAQTWSKELAFELEKHFINEYQSYSHDASFGGYNMTKGGDGVDSDTARRNIRIRNAKAVAAGTHNFQGDAGSEFQKDRISSGVHNWAGDKGKLLSKARIANGTHNQLIVHKCPHCAKTGKGSVMFRHHFEQCKHR